MSYAPPKSAPMRSPSPTMAGASSIGQSPRSTSSRRRASAVGDRIAIFVDGGFRRGTDVIKALALGADAVLAGRAALYGVAAAGKDGVKRALDILRQEILRDLGLLGVPSIES